MFLKDKNQTKFYCFLYQTVKLSSILKKIQEKTSFTMNLFLLHTHAHTHANTLTCMHISFCFFIQEASHIHQQQTFFSETPMICYQFSLDTFRTLFTKSLCQSLRGKNVRNQYEAPKIFSKLKYCWPISAYCEVHHYKSINGIKAEINMT